MAQARMAARQRGEEQTRARILGVAAEWFGAHGYAATSIRDIAREVGVTVGAIYVHFPSKDRLLVAVYEEGVRRIGEAVDAVPATVPPWERLEAAARAHLDALFDNAGFARVIVRVIPTDVPEAAKDLRRLRHGYEARFRRLVDALDVAPGFDRTLLRLQLIGALNATQAWYKQGGGGADTKSIASQFVAALRTGAASGKGRRG
ncbi:MAG: TetR/AcrR family transcriptional regulator [Hyphomonadaceae bacterium]|nr:TetR/AcrR family transcriptional regulator [Hyphomonadaceae bacterium]